MRHPSHVIAWCQPIWKHLDMAIHQASTRPFASYFGVPPYCSGSYRHSLVTCYITLYVRVLGCLLIVVCLQLYLPAVLSCTEICSTSNENTINSDTSISVCWATMHYICPLPIYGALHIGGSICYLFCYLIHAMWEFTEMLHSVVQRRSHTDN